MDGIGQIYMESMIDRSNEFLTLILKEQDRYIDYIYLRWNIQTKRKKGGSLIMRQFRDEKIEKRIQMDGIKIGIIEGQIERQATEVYINVSKIYLVIDRYLNRQ